MRAWRVLGCLVAIALLAAACGRGSGSGPSGAAPQKEKVLVVAFPGDVDTFDPAFTVGTRTSQTVIQNTFDQLEQYSLVEERAEDGTPYWRVDTSQIKPMLAESRSISADGKVVTWKLRRDATYHDGKPVDARAIVEGYRRIYDAQGISYWLLTMGSVMSPDYFRAVDDYTVEMRMDVPNQLVLMNNVMHNTSAVHPDDVKAHATASDSWATEYFKKNLATGNGPYMLEEYKPGDRIVLRAYPKYYAGKAKIDKVILKIVPDATQRILLLKKGEVDIIEDAPVKELDALKQDPNIRVISVKTPRVGMLELNNTIPPFDNKLVRQAVAYAVPYDAIVQDVYKGYAIRALSLVGEGMPTHEPVFGRYQTDLEKARQLLAQAGYPDGKGLPPVKITVKVGWEEDERMAVLIADNLRKIGFNVEVEKLTYAAFNELEQAGKLQAFVDYWISWVNDPFYHLSWIVRSDSPTNYVRYKNARVDELIAKYTLTTDLQGREQASKEIQAILADEVPHVYLVQPTWNVPMRKNVKGYAYLNDELLRFWYMDKE